MSGGCEGFSLETAVSFGGKTISKTEALVTDSRLVMEVPVFSMAVGEWGLKTWGPGHPDLYDVRFTLKRDGEVADRVLSYFGMRDIRVREQDVLLNGAPLYQRLILNQGYWKDSGLTPPDEAAMIKDIEKIFAFGYNGARLHQKVEDERFLYWCDVMGLLVWSEAPAHYFFDDRAVKNFTAEWMEIVGQFYNHPSVITWVPFNESWGMPSVKTDKRQQHFQQAVYHWTKTYDANRPVIVNDGWEHTVSDILTLHDYQPSGDVFFEKYFNNQEAILSGKLCHDGTNAAFAEGFCYRGQPVVISEYGGIALDSGGVGWGYGNKAADEEDFLKRFESITGAIKKLPFVCGFCYTQLTDVQQEINGLMTMDRINKVDSEKIRAVNLKKTGKRMY
jgi:hypothetical protein